jgi:tricorn protease-like protein
MITQLHLVQKLVPKDSVALPSMSSQQVHGKCTVPTAVSVPSESDRSSSTIRFSRFCFKSGKPAAQTFVMPNQQAKVKRFGYFSSTDVEWHLSRMLNVRDVRLLSKRTEA